MTYKEFRKMSYGVYEWEVYLIDNQDDHWYYGEDAVNPVFDDKQVVSFNLRSNIHHDVFCTVDLI